MLMSLRPVSLDRYKLAILKSIWTLDTNHKKLLNSQITYATKLKSFLKKVKKEEYPGTYEDSLLVGGRRYYITYLFCSPTYLQAKLAEHPDTMIAYQLRVNEDNNFYHVIVRLWDRKWTVDMLKKNGVNVS